MKGKGHRYGLRIGVKNFDEGEPEEGDLTTSDHAKFYQDGKLAVDMDPGLFEAEMWKVLDAHMNAQNFYPNVWFISDHGNAHLMKRPRGRGRR